MSSDDGGFVITGAANIERARLITLRRALKLEIETGMKRSSRGRPTTVLINEAMGTSYRNKKTTYEKFNAWLQKEHGIEPLPLRGQETR